MKKMDLGYDEERRAFLESKIRYTLRDIPDAGEVDLQCELLKRLRTDTFSFAADAEWQYVDGRDDLGRGDLVFASARNVESRGSHTPCEVLIIEVKFERPLLGNTSRVENRRRRARGAEQLQRSMQAWSQLHPNDDIWGAYYSNTTGKSFDAVSFMDHERRLELRNPLYASPAGVEEAGVQVDQHLAEREEETGWGTLAAAVGAGAIAVGVAYLWHQRNRREAPPRT